MRSLLATLVFTAALSAASAQLINPGFDTGDLTGWTSAPEELAHVYSIAEEPVIGIPPFNGGYSAVLVPGGSLVQTQGIYLHVGDKVGAWMNGSENGSGLGVLNLVPTVGPAVHVYWGPVYLPGETHPVRWNEVSYRIQQDGIYSIGVSNMEMSDYPSPSFLGVDDFSITPVPEASTYGFLAVGLGVAAIVRRRRSATAQTAALYSPQSL